MSMKKLFNKILHSDNLVISCTKRFFVLLCVWLWNVGALYSLYTYPPRYIYTKLKYEAESLAVHTIFFFVVFSAICMVDAFWVKESKDRNIMRYIAKLIIPMVPFLIVCPILYTVYPDKNLCNIFLAIQWLPVILTDSLLWGSVATAGIVVLLAIVFFVIPFLLLPKVSAIIGTISEKIRFKFLKNKYIKRNRINAYPVKLFTEDGGKLSAHLESVCGIFNEAIHAYFASRDCCTYDAKKIGIYFTETEFDNVYVGKKGIFAVVNISIKDNPNLYDVNLLADKCIDSITNIIDKTLQETKLSNSKDIVECVLKTADAFYPKESGLKRL